MNSTDNITMINSTHVGGLSGIDYSFWFLILFAISLLNKCRNSFHKSNHNFIHVKLNFFFWVNNLI